MIAQKLPQMHPAEFRQKHQRSKKEIAALTQIPLDSLSGYLADPDSRRYREAKPHILVLFGLLDQSLSQ